MNPLSFAFGFLVEFVTDDKVRNFSVVVGVAVALHSIKTSRAIARKKQSADVLFASRGDPRLQDGYAQLRLHHESETKNMRALANEANRGSDEAKAIRFLLNHWELLSVGIQADIYDEAMVKKSWFSAVTDSYERALPFIQASREADKKPTLFQEFEWLAKRWKVNPLPDKDGDRWYHFRWL